MAILANERGEVLLTKRAHDPAKDKWDFPGGFIEIGETAEQGLRREIREELALSVGALQYLCSLSGYYAYQGIDYPVLDIVFHGLIEDGAKLELDDDVAGYAFFAQKDIPWDELMSDRHRAALKRYFAEAKDS